MSFADRLNADRRLRLLRLLVNMPDNRADAKLLQGALEYWQHDVALDVVQGDLLHLQTHGCVEVSGDEGRVVAALRQKGEDVAMGRTMVPGVGRPSHEERAAGSAGLAAEIARVAARLGS